jgi:ribosomal 50S subunit-recycling heat shock protein
VRLDKFLQVSRLIKRREVAHRLCDHGRVRLNGHPAKPAAAVKAGDVITISQGDRRLVAKVLAVPERPGPGQGLVEILARTAVDEWHG